MFVVVWQFEIAEEKIAAFEAAYGPEGAWAQLFRNSASYLGTELLHDAYVAGSYLTIDRSCDALTSRETRIGAYTARAAAFVM